MEGALSPSIQPQGGLWPRYMPARTSARRLTSSRGGSSRASLDVSFPVDPISVDHKVESPIVLGPEVISNRLRDAEIAGEPVGRDREFEFILHALTLASFHSDSAWIDAPTSASAA
jgi:hypothetical protein